MTGEWLTLRHQSMNFSLSARYNLQSVPGSSPAGNLLLPPWLREIILSFRRYRHRAFIFPTLPLSLSQPVSNSRIYYSPKLWIIIKNLEALRKRRFVLKEWSRIGNVYFHRFAKLVHRQKNSFVEIFFRERKEERKVTYWSGNVSR